MIQQTAKDATKGAAPTAVVEGTKALDEQETRATIAHLLASPEIQAAIRDLAGAATQGATQALGDTKHVEQLTNGLVSLVARQAFDAALSEATSKTSQQQMQQIATSVADSAMRSATRALADELQTTLAPTIAAAIQKNVGPSAGALMDAPELRAALAHDAYQMAHEAVLGSNAALAELERKNKKTGLARISSWLGDSGWLLLVGGLLVFALVVANIALLSNRLLNGRRLKAA
jgi:hypothetical protein